MTSNFQDGGVMSARRSLLHMVNKDFHMQQRTVHSTCIVKM